MQRHPRRAWSASGLSCLFGMLAGCASEPTTAPFTPAPQTAYVAWFGATCFEDAGGAAVAEKVVAFQKAGASWATREPTDENGCVPSAGLSEGLYAVSVEGHEGAHDVYIADGDSIRVRLGGDTAGVEYGHGPSLSATILELVAAMDATEEIRRAAIDRALAHPSGTRLHTIGLLASFALQRTGGDPAAARWQNHSRADAQALLYHLPPDSPWLSAWPTAPIGAALTLGYEPSEHPAVRAILSRDPAGPVAANVLLVQMHAARARGDDERADAVQAFLARTPAFAPYASIARADQG